LAAGKVVQPDQLQLQIVRQIDFLMAEPTFRAAPHFVHSSTSQLALEVRALKQAIEPEPSDRSNRSVLVTSQAAIVPTTFGTNLVAEPKGKQSQRR
jgi:hypothetical protein